jgi:hypothetical protein
VGGACCNGLQTVGLETGFGFWRAAEYDREDIMILNIIKIKKKK